MTCLRAHETPIEELLADPESPAARDFLAHCEGCESCAAELARHAARTPRGGGRAVIVTAAAAVVGAAVAFFVFSGPETTAPEPERAEQPRPELATVEPEVIEPIANDTPQTESLVPEISDLELDVPVMVFNETVTIRSELLPKDRPALLAVRLFEPSTNSEPRPTKIVGFDSRVVDLDASIVGADRMHASFELAPGFLEPGRYIIHVKTTEKSHFPGRRYAIDVR